jgi:hypothetical protein
MKIVKNMAGLLLFALILTSCKRNETDDSQLGVRNIKVILKHKVGPQDFAIGSFYNNSFGETYKLNRFQYYISNVSLINTTNNIEEKEIESYHLIDANDAGSLNFNFSVNRSSYNAIVFYMGVDSLRNVSGAQTGALDPLNGMFWTWNSGYIMAKMEGSSVASSEPNNELIYHIGGYSGINKAVRKVVLPLGNPINTKMGSTCNITLNVDINKWFNGVHPIKIVEGGLAMSVSDRTKKFADNYATMFAVQGVVNQ